MDCDAADDLVHELDNPVTPAVPCSHETTNTLLPPPPSQQSDEELTTAVLPQPPHSVLSPSSAAAGTPAETSPPLPPPASAPTSPTAIHAAADAQPPPPCTVAEAMPNDSDEELASVALPVVNSGMSEVQADISSTDLRAAVVQLLSGRDLTQTTMRTLRAEVCQHLGLLPSALDTRGPELQTIATEVVKGECPRQSSPHAGTEDLGEEYARALRMVYNVTCPHPQRGTAEDGTVLRPPGDFSRQEILNAVSLSIQECNASKRFPLKLLMAVVFRERHTDGEVHYHVALMADRQYRFGPIKKALLHNFGLATHWSTTHDHYASAVGYGYLPSPHKPLSDLDPVPLTWSATGTHPALADASRPPVSAHLIAQHREQARRARSEKGKHERFEDIHLWPIVVRENFVAGENGRGHLMGYAKRTGGEAMVKFCFSNWHKLDDLVGKIWEIEKVEEYIAAQGKSRVEVMQSAKAQNCCCHGAWIPAALELFALNRIDPDVWRNAVLEALHDGRSKGNVVCHVGLGGNEGKSFLLAPLMTVFGEDFVFITPPPSGFPLLGMEKAKVVLLDDWRFNEDILSYNLQLLWFEGKPFVIARPQNSFSGHLRYKKDAPIFISTLEADLLSVKKQIQQGDVSMMLKRLTVFRFTSPLETVQKIPACAGCFARFLMSRDEQSTLELSSTIPAPCVQQTSGAPPVSSRGSKRPRSWTVDDVVEFLGSCDLGHIADTIRVNGVDGELLVSLTDSEMMEELGLTKLQVKKIRLRLPQ